MSHTRKCQVCSADINMMVQLGTGVCSQDCARVAAAPVKKKRVRKKR